MKEIISFALPSVFLFIYMILSSIEFGSSVFLLFPKILKNNDSIETYTSPVWEITTIFLLFFTISIFAFFPKANYRLGTDLLPVVFTALAFLGIKIIGSLLIFYANSKSLFSRLCLFVGSFMTPIVFSLAFIYFMTGSWQHFLITPLYASLVGLITSNIIFISSTFFRLFGREYNNVILNKTIHISFIASVLCFTLFYSATVHAVPYMTMIAPFIWAIGFSIALFIFTEFFSSTALLLPFISAVCLVGMYVASLFITHVPYIVYPNLTIYNTFTSVSNYYFLMTACGIGMIFVLPSLGLLYYLFIYKNDTNKKNS